MKTIDDALAFADTFDKPANKYMSIVMLAAEVRRLREENERLRKWIRVEGDHNDTCTRKILGETCQGCQCTHGEIDAARCAKPEPTP